MARNCEQGAGHGLDAGRHLLRELFVRHDLSMHMVWIRRQGHARALPGNARVPHRSRRHRRVHVSGLTFALVIDSAPVMADGGWKLGVVMDGAATEQQAGALGRVLGGELGGPPAMLGPLIGEMVGIEQASVEWRQSGDTLTVRFGDLIDVEIKAWLSGALSSPCSRPAKAAPCDTVW